MDGSLGEMKKTLKKTRNRRERERRCGWEGGGWDYKVEIEDGWYGIHLEVTIRMKTYRKEWP